MVFILNKIDFGKYIPSGSYKVNAEVEYVSWVDGNKKEHRKKVTEKVKGTLDMIFKTEEEYNIFLDALKLTETDNLTHTIALSVNNTNDIRACEMFVYYELTRSIDNKWRDYFERFTLNVKEA